MLLGLVLPGTGDKQLRPVLRSPVWLIFYQPIAGVLLLVFALTVTLSLAPSGKKKIPNYETEHQLAHSLSLGYVQHLLKSGSVLI